MDNCMNNLAVQHDVTIMYLLRVLGEIEYHADPSDIEVWDAIQVVLGDFCTSKQLEQLENRNINPEFVLVLVEDTLKNLSEIAAQ